MGLELIFANIDREIKSKGFSQIHCGLSRQDIVDAANAYIDFLKLPDSLKQTIKLPSPKSGADIGYVLKKKEQGDYDDKELFHFDLNIDEFAEQFNEPVIEKFITYARFVYARSYATFKNLLNVIEPHQPGITAKFVGDCKPTCYLRFLAYPEGAGIAAKGHFDKGAFTLSLGESTPGLIIEGKPANNNEYNAILMPGITSPEIAPALGWKKAWHKSHYNGKPYAKGIGRWAIVFFSNTIDQRFIDQVETHKPF